MRVVVVGGTGNVGSRLVDRLSEHPGIGHVVAASRRQPKRLADGVEWRRVDLSEGGFGTVLREADAVVHLAWLFQPTRVTQVTWRANVEGSARLLEAAAEAGVGAIVYASSVGAYSPRRSSERVDESWPTHGVPTAAYSVEKAYVERLLDSFENRHPEVRVVRLRPVFTFRAESAVQQRRLFAGPLVPARLVGQGRIPVLPDPGGLTFQAIHTDDVVQAYLQALTQPVSGAFNLAAEPTYRPSGGSSAYRCAASPPDSPARRSGEPGPPTWSRRRRGCSTYWPRRRS